MSGRDDDQILRSIRLYREALEQTQRLFIESGRIAEGSYGWLAGDDARATADLSNGDMASQMNDLHQGFVMKVFAECIPNASSQAIEQRQLGRILLEHLWGTPVMGSQLREAIDWLIATSRELKWFDVVRPFLELPSLRDSWGQVETMAIRMATLIAAIDGVEDDADRTSLQRVRDQLANTQACARGSSYSGQLTHFSRDGQNPRPQSAEASQTDHQVDIDHARDAIAWLRVEAKRLREGTETQPGVGREAANRPTPTASGGPPRPIPTTNSNSPTLTTPEPIDDLTSEEKLAEARAKLDRLIGLDAIKNQIQTLSNFLKMEKHRQEAGLPTTQPSLHMAFVGNPGTGKTTVARIVADIYGALGVLSKGHLVETDRSGLVAEYAGQTGPKTNAKIDEALDGVLFIDEAYTLVDESGTDQYGREAVQTLLKRMEDQRDRLVVILAGYPKEMTKMIRSNPGLSSRVGTTMHFDDYDPEALCRIYELIANKSEYELPPLSRQRLLRGFAHLYFNRDRHFGNGRTSRNSFERSVRRLANRIAMAPEITRELLTTMYPSDIEVPGLKQEQLEALTKPEGMVRVICQHCDAPEVIQDNSLGVQRTCPSCNETYQPRWGSPVVDLQVPADLGIIAAEQHDISSEDSA